MRHCHTLVQEMTPTEWQALVGCARKRLGLKEVDSLFMGNHYLHLSPVGTGE